MTLEDIPEELLVKIEDLGMILFGAGIVVGAIVAVIVQYLFGMWK